MNLLQIRDNSGNVVRTELVDGIGPIEGGLVYGGATVSILPMAGYQLNGHRWDCRCGICRPDLIPLGALVTQTDYPAPPVDPDLDPAVDPTDPDESPLDRPPQPDPEEPE